VQQIWRTQNSRLLRTSRQGQFRYAIPLKKGIYELHLHFAETVYGPESSGTGGEGSRIMTVRANGKDAADPLRYRGRCRAQAAPPMSKSSPELSRHPMGCCIWSFPASDGKPAILSAIEILPGFRGHIRPVRLLARQTPYYSNDSHWWSPDNYFEGGQLAGYTAPVTGPTILNSMKPSAGETSPMRFPFRREDTP
jgi:hypothetical protein